MNDKSLVAIVGIVFAIFGFIIWFGRKSSRLQSIGFIGLGLSAGAMGLVMGASTAWNNFVPFLFLLFAIGLVGAGFFLLLKKPGRQ